LSNLAWIDEFFYKIKDYIFLRDEDAVLILPPNRVYKLNPTGLVLLKHLFSGKSIRDFPGLVSETRKRDVNNFFSDFKAVYENKMTDPDHALAVDRTQFTFDFTALPILGELALTYKCNNRCVFCYAGCGSSVGHTCISPDQADSTKELSTRQIKAIIRIFRDEAKIPFFSFTGGEPLLRKDLEALIAYAGKLKLHTNLISNGTLATPERAERLASSGLKTAQISLESVDPDIHDVLTGITGAWRRTIDGIKNLMGAGISVQTNTTLTKKNIGNIGELPAFLSEMGVHRFAMNLFIPPANGPVDDSLFLPYSKTGSIVDEIRREAKKAGLTFFWYSPIPHCLYNPIARGLGNKSCAAMDGLLSVAPNADVLPCSSYPESMGNILRDSFREIWFSERARYFKNKRYAPDECTGCDKFVACQGACPLYWKYAGTSEIGGTEEIAVTGEYSESERSVEVWK
jgi:radical SAM protein with 4Fe4S-binding SPASM domain